MRLVASVVAWSVLALAGCRSSERSTPPPTEPVPEVEPFRPLYHFTTPTNWINDPNGPVFFEGEYHLFYQYNPLGDQWGNISWGHAVSEDQVHWRHLPVAIPAEGDTLIFSGSAVADSENTSGLCEQSGEGTGRDEEGCIVAIHTAFVVDPSTLVADQVQNIAASQDRGLTFQPYAGNPVLDAPEPDFRDPNVFWHAPTEQWVMTLALAVERCIAVYGSPNLRDWTLLSEFGPAGAVGGIWECPVLVELPVEGAADEERRWLLKVDSNPGHVAGGSGAQYFVGSFDGQTFVPDEIPPQVLWVDWGRDFYCALQWTNEPAPGGERTWIAWMSDWTYAADTPTSPWRGAMTIPRALSLRRTPAGVRLVQRPIAALEELRGASLRARGDDLAALTADLRESGILGRANELMVSIEPGSATEVGLRVRRAADEELVIGAFFDIGSEDARVFVDRTRAGEIGFNEAFAGRHEAPVRLREGRLDLHVYLDSSSVEVFAAGGEAVLTDLAFSSPDAIDGALYAEGGPVGTVELELWELGPALPEGTIDPVPGEAPATVESALVRSKLQAPQGR